MTDKTADMTHGDIKPQNVLVFSDNSGAVFAKLADFGYSGWDVHESQKVLIRPPRSRPWDAPEYHHRGFSVSQAKLLDIFSFGMLCMWILFEDEIRTVSSVQTAEVQKLRANPTVMGNYAGIFQDHNATDQLKRGDGLLRLARQLTESATVSVNQKESLLRFFNSTLAHEPHRRSLNLEQLAFFLGPDW